MKHIKNFNVFEGVAFKDTKKPYAKKAWDPDRKADFRDKIKSHIKSLGCTSKQIGNDLEVLFDGDDIMQLMFRDDYVGIRKSGNKFVDEFKYTEFGKIKSKITDIVKK